MRIAFITHRFLPRHRAGVEVFTYDLAEALKDRGYDPLIICAQAEGDGTGSLAPPLIRDDFQSLPVFRLRVAPCRDAPFRSAFDRPEIGEAVFRLLGAERAELVHVINCLFLSASVIEAAHRAGLPVVWTLTDYWPICWKTTLLTWDERLCPGDWQVPAVDCLACMVSESRTYRNQRLLQKIPPDLLAGLLFRLRRIGMLRRRLPVSVRDALEAVGERPRRFRSLVGHVDAMVAINRFAYELFCRSGFPHDRLKLIIQTINPARLASSGSPPQSRRTEAAEGDCAPLRIGFIGRINWVKGADLVVRAFRQADVGSRAILEFWGDFDDAAFEARLKDLVGDDPRIRFLGSFLPRELGMVLSRLDLLVVASRWYETGPLTIVEAQAAGIPVICPRLGEMERMVVHEVNGLHFERGDVADLAAQLRRVIDEPSRLHYFRQNIGPIRSFNEMVAEYEALYMECFRRRRSGEESRR
jgi:glycosyltransferase involved in cell wall biosynthesis